MDQNVITKQQQEEEQFNEKALNLDSKEIAGGGLVHLSDIQQTESEKEQNKHPSSDSQNVNQRNAFNDQQGASPDDDVNAFFLGN
jgi:hypothetical protein